MSMRTIKLNTIRRGFLIEPQYEDIATQNKKQALLLVIKFLDTVLQHDKQIKNVTAFGSTWEDIQTYSTFQVDTIVIFLAGLTYTLQYNRK